MTGPIDLPAAAGGDDSDSDSDSGSRPLHVMHVVCSDGFAGVERYVQETAIAMAGDGCAVTVVGGAAQMRNPLRSAGIRWFEGRTPARTLIKCLSQRNVDVIVTHMTEADVVGAVVGLVSRTAVVSVRHFASPRGSSRLGRSTARLLGRTISEQIAVSEFVAAAIEGRCVVVPSGVDSVERVDESSREPFVLVLQRLESEKRTDVAIRAWAAADAPASWRLVIAGRGSLGESLRSLAQELGVSHSVDFIGFVEDPIPWLERASILLASAPGEAFGLSVVEAMAHGMPIVAARGGAHRETVGGVEQAQLFDEGDWRGAGHSLAELIADPEARQRYGSALRERQRTRFDIRTQVAASLRILDLAARNRGRG